MNKLIRAASKKDLSPGKILRIRAAGDEIIIVCQASGQYQAVSGICSHEYWPLHEGYVIGNCIVCPLHGSEFDLETGKCLRPPASNPLKTYQVIETGDELYIEINQEELARP